MLKELKKIQNKVSQVSLITSFKKESSPILNRHAINHRFDSNWKPQYNRQFDNKQIIEK